MNRRGQIGQILTSAPALILVFVIMLIFVVISGFMAKDFNSSEAKTPKLSQKEIEFFGFPPKNADSGTLIDDFLNSEVAFDGKIAEITNLLYDSTCLDRASKKPRDIESVLSKNFKSFSYDGFYLFTFTGTSLEPKNGEYYYSNIPGLIESHEEPQINDIIKSRVKEIFDKTNSQRKTICVKDGGNIGGTLFVSAGELDES